MVTTEFFGIPQKNFFAEHLGAIAYVEYLVGIKCGKLFFFKYFPATKTCENGTISKIYGRSSIKNQLSSNFAARTMGI